MVRSLLFCVLLFGMAGCSGPLTPTPLPSSDLNLVIRVQGQLRVRREGWSTDAPARLGTVLHYGDLLKLDGDSQATVLCADLLPKEVQSGEYGVPCTVSQPQIIHDNSLVNSPRESDPGTFPLILAPRRTHILDPHPILRWTNASSATTYTVSVLGSAPESIWQNPEPVTQTELTYPATAPTLVPSHDYNYKLIVEGGGHSSVEDGTPDLGFAPLTEDDARKVHDAEKKIEGLGLPDEPTRLVIAYLYAGYDLNAEAIEQLSVLDKTTQEPATLRLLGEIYYKIGLKHLALAHYLRAVNLSQQFGDIEGQAIAERAAGGINEDLGNKSDGQKECSQAINDYSKLGDTQMLTPTPEQMCPQQASR